MAGLEAVIGKEFINGKGEDVSLEQLLAQGPKVICILFTATWFAP